jgi:hypothetical protein
MAIAYIDSYRNTISEWGVGFRYGNFTLKLARGKKNLASRGLIFGGEEISIPETRPIRKSYISFIPHHRIDMDASGKKCVVHIISSKTA